MKRLIVTAILLLATPVFGGGHVSSAGADLINKEGAVIGMATLQKGSKGVLIYVKVSGLTPGKHGLHLHSHGNCDPDTGFKSAKGHVGKVEGTHGLLNPEGPEPGDLPNIFIGTDGTGEMEAYTTFVSIDGAENALLDEDGSTLVIHEMADDHVSQPIGAAGGRVACGTIVAR